MKIKEHTSKALMKYTKGDLVEYCMCLEYNINVLEASFDVQCQNCLKLIEEMNVFNKTYENAKKLEGVNNDDRK